MSQQAKRATRKISSWEDGDWIIIEEKEYFSAANGSSRRTSQTSRVALTIHELAKILHDLFKERSPR